MKFIVTMKDPDTLHDAVSEAAQKEISEMSLPDDEKELLLEGRIQKAMKAAGKWEVAKAPKILLI